MFRAERSIGTHWPAGGTGLAACYVPMSEPPRVRIISDNPLYAPYEGVADEINIIGRIRWFAREV